MPTPAVTIEEPTISLPTGRLLTVVIAIPIVTGAVWWMLGLAIGWSDLDKVAGVVGAGLVGAVAIASVLVMTPWVTRPVSSWMNFWLGSTVLRLLVTPAIGYLLYSATSLGGSALALAVVVTYVLTLFCEAGVLSSYLKRAC